MSQIYKYPRTPHIQGSRSQPGDENLDSIPFATIQTQHLVIEEKVDGANAAISFTSDGQLRLQSRGHYLTGGGREKHFNLFKQWAHTHASAFWEVLGSRFILFGES
jgi:RNA ligase